MEVERQTNRDGSCKDGGVDVGEKKDSKRDAVILSSYWGRCQHLRKGQEMMKPFLVFSLYISSAGLQGSTLRVLLPLKTEGRACK